MKSDVDNSSCCYSERTVASRGYHGDDQIKTGHTVELCEEGEEGNPKSETSRILAQSPSGGKMESISGKGPFQREPQTHLLVALPDGVERRVLNGQIRAELSAQIGNHQFADRSGVPGL